VENVGGPGAAARGRRGTRRRTGVSAEPVNMEEMAKSITRVIEKSDTERAQIREAVKTNFLFTSLDDDQMKTVLDAMQSYKYKAGETVIQQGDDGDEFFVLESGNCECYLDFHDGNPPKMVKTYECGESFGELALMYNTARAASIKAKTDAHCWAMDRATFRKVLLFSTAQKRDQYEEFLGNVPLLSSLDKYERSKVADALLQKKYADGEFILKEGDTDDTNFYILAEGEAVATKIIDDSGEPREVMQYKMGDFFGELALITNNPRAANVVSKGCKCVYIDKASFTRLLGPCEDMVKRNKDNYEEMEKRILGN